MVGCKDNRAPMPECSNCGWNKQENARRCRLPLIKGADGLYSRSEESKKSTQRTRKTRAVAVIYTSPHTGEKTRYSSIVEAAKAAGVSHWTMSSWLSGAVSKRCAKHWRYADEND